MIFYFDFLVKIYLLNFFFFLIFVDRMFVLFLIFFSLMLLVLAKYMGKPDEIDGTAVFLRVVFDVFV